MKIGRKLAIGILLLLGCTMASSVLADTVYMKTGRTIESSSVRVEGDRVFVRLYGGEVAFPLSIIDRIVEDDAVEATRTEDPVVVEYDPDDPNADPSLAPPAGAAAPAQQGDPTADPGQQVDPATDPAQQPPADPPPEQTREYWQERARPHLEMIERIDGELDRLRGLSASAAQRVEIDRAEATKAQAEGQLDAIRVEARRLGIPPGWLR